MLDGPIILDGETFVCPVCRSFDTVYEIVIEHIVTVHPEYACRILMEHFSSSATIRSSA